MSKKAPAQSTWDKFVQICLFPFLLLVLIIVIPIACLVLPFYFAKEMIGWIKSQIYYAWNSGSMFLVVDGQHGWREFVSNNLIPAAPANLKPIWCDSPSTSNFRERVLRSNWEQRPFLLQVKPFRIKTLSLHENFAAIGKRGKADEEVRAQCRTILNNGIVEIQKDASRSNIG